jgi:hypothetical protein
MQGCAEKPQKNWYQKRMKTKAVFCLVSVTRGNNATEGMETNHNRTWGSRQPGYLVIEEENHVGDAVVGPVAMHKQELLQKAELRDGKVARHDLHSQQA